MLMQAWHYVHLITFLLFMRRWYSPDFYDFGIRCSTDYAGERRADERRVLFPRDANSTDGQAAGAEDSAAFPVTVTPITPEHTPGVGGVV